MMLNDVILNNIKLNNIILNIIVLNNIILSFKFNSSVQGRSVRKHSASIVSVVFLCLSMKDPLVWS